jgi:hypothetical protein
VQAGTELVFSASNWHINHMVTIGAAEDIDKTDGTAVLHLSSPDLPATTVTLTERDNDPNVAPAAFASQVSLAQDSTQVIQLAGEDPDAYPQPLVYVIVDSPDHGTISRLNSTTGTLVYTPNPGYAGPDAFTFTLTDGKLDSNPARVSITVQPLPVIPDENEPPTNPGDGDGEDGGDDDDDTWNDDGGQDGADTGAPVPDDRDPDPVVTVPPCGAGLVSMLPLALLSLVGIRLRTATTRPA